MFEGKILGARLLQTEIKRFVYEEYKGNLVLLGWVSCVHIAFVGCSSAVMIFNESSNRKPVCFCVLIKRQRSFVE